MSFRILPELTDANAFFWTSGRDGRLRFLRCADCRTWVHPPAPVCPACLGRGLAPEVASGQATLHTFTVNWQPWIPGFEPPYVVAIVELPELPGLRLTTNLVDVSPDDVRIGMALEIRFEERDGVWLPLFGPLGESTA